MFRLHGMLTRRGFLWILAALSNLAAVSILAAALAFGAPGAAAQNSPSKPATPAPPNEEYLRKVIKWNPWFLAAASGDTKTIQDYLTSGTQVNARDTFGRTALYIATAYEHADLVRLLLKSGADPNLPSEDSSDDAFSPLRRRTHTALEIATRSQNADIRSSLEDAGGALIPLGSNENGLGSLPLLYQCIEENSTATLQALLEKESFIRLRAANTCEGGSRTFPDYVLSKGREQCYAVLLERAIGPRGTQAERNDLLTAAVGFCRTQDVRRLLGAGASLASVPMDYLAVPVSRGRKDLVQILLDAHLRPGSVTLSSAVSSGNLDILKMLVDNGIGVPGEHGNWALANAARQGKMAMVEYLIAQGADPNGVQIDGLAPVELALVNRHQDVVDYLILKGAKPITEERRALLLKPPREYVVTTETLVSAEPPSTGSPAKSIGLSRYNLYQVTRKINAPEYPHSEVDRFLVFAGSSNRIFLGPEEGGGPFFFEDWGAQSRPIDEHKPKEWIRTKWVEPGKIAAAAWLIGYPGSGGTTLERTSMLLVRGSQVKPILTWSYTIYSQSGVANHQLGKQRWLWDSAGQVLEIRLIVTDYVEAYSYGGGRLQAAVPSGGYRDHLPPSRVSEATWRYQLAGDEMRYMDGKGVENIAGGFPVLDVAERYGLTIRDLVELNPELKGKVFCTGPVVVSTSIPPIDKDREY